MDVKRKKVMPDPRVSKAANCDLGETGVSRVESVKQQIYIVRGQRVMFDQDLARLYGVATKRLNQQLRRNLIGFIGTPARKGKKDKP
jgi:hypothetical protein